VTVDEGWTACARCGEAQRNHGLGCDDACAEFVSYAGLGAENARLRAALEWYGEQARLCRLIHSEGDAGRHALNNDGGAKARAALGECKGA